MTGLPQSRGRELVWDVGPGRLELVKASHDSFMLFSVSCDPKLQASGAKATVKSVRALSTDGCRRKRGREGCATHDPSLCQSHVTCQADTSVSIPLCLAEHGRSREPPRKVSACHVWQKAPYNFIPR